MDEYMVIELQPREAVINRLTVLRALVERSLLEATAIDEGATNDLEERRFDLLAELLSSPAADAIAPEELVIFQTPIAKIPEEDEVALILAAESFGDRQGLRPLPLSAATARSRRIERRSARTDLDDVAYGYRRTGRAS